jgi:hypothetical protein
MTRISQNAIKSGFFAISGRNSGEMEREFHYYLKKQSQFISYRVLRDAYCENEFEKTKPISGCPNEGNFSINKGLYKQYRFRSRGKESQSKPKANIDDNPGFIRPYTNCTTPKAVVQIDYHQC